MAKSTRNEFEFMSMVLDALGVEYEEADVKQRERWRGKVLDGWGVEYVTDDLKQFARWRQKCLEGLAKNSGGGWRTMYNDTIIGLDDGNGHYGNTFNVVIDGNPIKVTYDGVEYMCPKVSGLVNDYYYGAPYDSDLGGYDFTDYPFHIGTNLDTGMAMDMQTGGEHSLKIEVQQNSGSGDFTTAQVTITNSTSGVPTVLCPNVIEDDGGLSTGEVSLSASETKTVTMVLYKGTGFIRVMAGQVAGCQGDVTADKINSAIVTGDGSFNIIGGIS